MYNHDPIVQGLVAIVVVIAAVLFLATATLVGGLAVAMLTGHP